MWAKKGTPEVINCCGNGPECEYERRNGANTVSYRDQVQHLLREKVTKINNKKRNTAENNKLSM